MLGCAWVPPAKEAPVIETSYRHPPIGERKTVGTGEIILRQYHQSVVQMLKITRDVTFHGLVPAYRVSSGYFLISGRDDNYQYFLPFGGESSGTVERLGLADPFQTLRVDRKTHEVCAITVFGVPLCTTAVKGIFEYRPAPGTQRHDRRLVYLGKVGETQIRIGYRETIGEEEYANDVLFDLSESALITYQGATLSVVSATGNFLSYNVVTYFDETTFLGGIGY